VTQPHDLSYQRLVEIRHLSKSDTGRRVLVVEDNADSRVALAEALEKEGYEVVAVENGTEALDRLRWSWQPECVVLDMRMPVMTGWELREIMSADARLRDIPVIGMTGGRWKPEDARGFFALLAKPIILEELLVGLEAVWHLTGMVEGEAPVRKNERPLG
jgi:CheY-like chemotaxis protein